MKRTLLLVFAIVMLVMAGTSAFSQVNPNDPQYQEMKAQGLIPQPTQVNPTEPVPAIMPNPGGKLGNLMIPLDGSFSLAMNPNDDGSSGVITLPFTFCFYGTDYNNCYINNNGNISFGSAYFQYSPSGFPSTDYVMIAPFWGDVDTRLSGGEERGAVYYRLEPHRMVVIWNNVGYYSYNGDLRNTFELIITDGTDPLVGINKNVAFSYTTMQWTTGEASGAANGFCVPSGTPGCYPATVGVNKGDGTNYALVSRFDHAGTDFGGVGGLSGVSYLDGKQYTFDACDTYVPPIGVPVSSWWALAILGIALLGFGTFYILRLKG